MPFAPPRPPTYAFPKAKAREKKELTPFFPLGMNEGMLLGRADAECRPLGEGVGEGADGRLAADGEALGRDRSRVTPVIPMHRP